MSKEKCIACAVALKEGDKVYSDVSGGILHAVCAGPERDGFATDDGDPLPDGAPIPEPWDWLDGMSSD
jgi:hypothetical protein